ncbi:hypothetical protein BDF20DRAFT_944325 [Mycotypha africana]|uniref:uncharacterized protein n=1 Tax=Mycotypha africana TaxID=64632 RepID=UPI0023011E5D|nr:uncharacterized protein BDF20DRAFT_944325 [Mycotypha africana]KAI8975471.1 hypothetical protein BDF20DRAFT_944325 [Mycotypha africana]
MIFKYSGTVSLTNHSPFKVRSVAHYAFFINLLVVQQSRIAVFTVFILEKYITYRVCTGELKMTCNRFRYRVFPKVDKTTICSVFLDLRLCNRKTENIFNLQTSFLLCPLNKLGTPLKTDLLCFKIEKALPPSYYNKRFVKEANDIYHVDDVILFLELPQLCLTVMLTYSHFMGPRFIMICIATT